MRNTGALSNVVAVIWSGSLAFAILAFSSACWGGLLSANMKTGASIPWSVAPMALILWLFWRYLGGSWSPRRTSEARRRCLRANPAPGRAYGWALAAGALAIAALAGLWIVFFQLFRMSPNNVPVAGIPPVSLILFLLMASLVSPIAEEAAFRGYCQGILEQRFSGTVAVIISSAFFALAHLSQGFFWPKLFVYYLAGVALGTIAYAANSILVSIPVHIAADLTFFTLVWPFDGARRLVSEGGADRWFWIHVAQALVFGALAIPAFRRFARTKVGRAYVDTAVTD